MKIVNPFFLACFFLNGPLAMAGSLSPVSPTVQCADSIHVERSGDLISLCCNQGQGPITKGQEPVPADVCTVETASANPPLISIRYECVDNANGLSMSALAATVLNGTATIAPFSPQNCLDALPMTGPAMSPGK